MSASYDPPGGWPDRYGNCEYPSQSDLWDADGWQIALQEVEASMRAHGFQLREIPPTPGIGNRILY